MKRFLKAYVKAAAIAGALAAIYLAGSFAYLAVQ